jgi:DNA-binding winged helix-turn-helix (wHTH) protein
LPRKISTWAEQRAERRAERERQEVAIQARLRQRAQALQGNRRRCRECDSTVYCQTVLLRGLDGYPSGYLLEWVCWGGGHIVREQWRSGSPVPRSRATSPVSTRLVATRPTGSRPAPVAGTSPPRHRRRKEPVRVIHQDTQLQPGCDERCQLFPYLNPEDPGGPVYVIRVHHPDPHNAYGCEGGRSGPLPISWKGIYIDGAEFLVVVDEQPIGQKLTRVEWQLLRALVCDFGRIVAQRTLIKRTWGAEYDESDSHLLRVHMARLRRKLFAPDPVRFIATHQGVGYGIGVEMPNRARTNGALSHGVLT